MLPSFPANSSEVKIIIDKGVVFVVVPVYKVTPENCYIEQTIQLKTQIFLTKGHRKAQIIQKGQEISNVAVKCYTC